jgi:hypothetical protein
MKIPSPKIIASIGVLTTILALGSTLAADDHNVVTPDDIK